MDLIIDGYNLIGSEHGLRGSLEPKRNSLVRRVSEYQKVKRFGITVVFDGWREGSADERVEKSDGVTVLYSRLNEKADAVIIRLARQKGSGSVVVTSDREIRSAVERFGAVAVSAGEFSRILRDLEGGRTAGDYDTDADEDDFGSSRKGRGGNPNRLSKTDRRRQDKLRKLRL